MRSFRLLVRTERPVLLHLARRMTVFALAIAFTASASAADLRVSVIAGPARDCLQKATLRGVSEDAKNAIEVPLQAGKTSYVLGLPSAGLWTVRVASETCWSETRPFVDGTDTDITLKIYEKATVEGDFSTKQVLATGSLRGAVFLRPASGEYRNEGADVDCR